MTLSPFILLIVFVIYGEFSNNIETRFVGRVLYYFYTMSVMVPMYIPNENYAVLTGLILSVGGLLLATLNSDNLISKIAFIFSSIVAFLSYTSIYFQDYTFLMSVPYFPEYSNIMFRDGCIVGLVSLGCRNKLHVSDWKLDGLLLVLGTMELLI